MTALLALDFAMSIYQAPVRVTSAESAITIVLTSLGRADAAKQTRALPTQTRWHEQLTLLQDLQSTVVPPAPTSPREAKRDCARYRPPARSTAANVQSQPELDDD